MLRILVAEDDGNVRSAVVEALRTASYEVTDVHDGQQAAERLLSTTFDVVVTDVKLPRVDGLTLFRKVRQSSPRTAVILMTSFATTGEAVAAMKEGAHDYLTKPFDEEELLLRVRAIAEKKALERELEEARARLSGSAV